MAVYYICRDAAPTDSLQIAGGQHPRKIGYYSQSFKGREVAGECGETSPRAGGGGANEPPVRLTSVSLTHLRGTGGTR